MNLVDFLLTKCEGQEFDSCVNSPCRWASVDGCAHPEHPRHLESVPGKLAQMNQQLLSEANLEQTKRCRHLRGGVLLLEEMAGQGAAIEDGETGLPFFMIPGELWERIEAYLADFAAVGRGPLTLPSLPGGEGREVQ